MSIPYRFDYINCDTVNSQITKLNKKLQKLIRTLPHTRFLDPNNDRKLFTNNGLHRNRLGKHFVAAQIALHILTTFNLRTLSPLPLEWHDWTKETSQIHVLNKSELQTRNSHHLKKKLVTRTDDFYGNII